MSIIDRYIRYVSTVRRYSQRTVEIYSDILNRYADYQGAVEDDDIVASIRISALRNYEVHLMEDLKEVPRTVNLHMSVLSGFNRYLVKQGLMQSNQVRLVSRPKVAKRLPDFYRQDSMEKYFESTAHAASADDLELLLQLPHGDSLEKGLYQRRLARMVVSLLFSTGIRRSELVGLNIGSVDFSRHLINVHGKGDKMREVPMTSALSGEISMYLKAADKVLGPVMTSTDPLLRTTSGARLYPVLVDRIIKSELEGVPGITGRRSPHVLRHTIATELLTEGTDLNSIKELLGHSSLAATQVYTHNTIERLKSVYNAAHPRAEKKV